MGKERNELIRRYGGVPVAEERLSDTKRMRRYVQSYADEGRLPPEIEAIRRKTAALAALVADDTGRRPRKPLGMRF